MAENEVQDQETGTPEPSDEEVWDSVVEEDSDVTEATNEAEQETEEQAEPVAEDSEEAEDVAEEEETPEEEPKHDYEQRYKSLEKEFHKRNQAAKEMKAQYDDMRLQMVERDQQLQSLKQQVDEVTKEPEKPDPSDPDILDNFFSEEDKETMEEFGELTKTFRKVVQHELAKAKQAEPEPQADDMNSRVEQLEGAAKQYMYEKFLADHEKAMVRDVGKFYTQLDRDPDFQKFVLDSPALTQMMTKSTEAKDHAAVMNLYLDKTGTRSQWEPTKASKKDPTPKQQQRRVAATGAVRNTAPRMEKNIANMNDEELWDSIPEQEAEYS